MDAFIALGGNVGDVLSTFRAALKRFDGEGMQVRATSSAYRTLALTAAPDDIAPDYWNAVCQVSTELEPHELLRRLLRLELDAGRIRHQRWEPRPLDLDLLVYGDAVVHSSALRLPHPGLRSRVFVLRPFVEIAPDTAIPPGGSTVAALFDALPDLNEGILAIRASWLDAAFSPLRTEQQRHAPAGALSR